MFRKRRITGAILRRLLTGMVMAALAVLGLASDLGAQSQAPDFEAQLQTWETRLDQARAALRNDFSEVDVGTVENRLEQVAQQARQARDRARSRLESAKKELEALGEPPAQGQPEEAPEIARLRDDLQQRVAEAEAHAKRASLMLSQVDETLGAIAGWEQARVRAQVLEHHPPPLSPSIWAAAAVDAAEFTALVLTSPIAWWQERAQSDVPHMELLLAALATLIGLLIGWPLRHRVLRHFGRDPQEQEPTYARRIVAAFADGVANAVIPVAIILFAVAALAWQGVLGGLFAYLIYASALAIAFFLTVFGLARAALSPYMVQWRIVPVEPAYIGTLLRAVATVLGLLLVSLVLLATAWESEHLTRDMEAVFFLLQVTATALALAWLLNPRYWATSITASQRIGTADVPAETPDVESDQEPAESPGRIRLIRGLRWLVLMTPLLPLAGYGRLAFYLQSRLVVTGAVAGLALLLRLALHEALERILAGRERKRRRRAPAESADATDSGVRVAVFWAGLAIDVLMLVPLIYLLLLLYGVPLTTLGRWTQQLLSGITVGNITISLADILVALLVLMLGVFATNLVRRWLANRLLPNTRLDIGARNSIAAGISYVGIALAILLAVAALGIDFSNLALVAGALSLGIGFGLQNVVQNFAAGILLLIERPIKVGDWIKVGTTEGTVKRISVRSTEVETFNRSSVFVPNSDLIASPVTNWTHKNRIARIILSVRAAYGSDPRQVEEILLRCARESEQVLRFPEPYVWFLGFGESALDFELRCYIGDTDYFISADSELYFAIEAAFREAGIEIPVPQRDLYIRSHESASSAEKERSGAGTGEAPRQPAPSSRSGGREMPDGEPDS